MALIPRKSTKVENCFGRLNSKTESLFTFYNAVQSDINGKLYLLRFIVIEYKEKKGKL
jgi:hypothetical protein